MTVTAWAAPLHADELPPRGPRAEEVLASLEAQPSPTRELSLRRIVKAWLEGQRKGY